MKVEPKVGEIIVWDYQRYKTVETNESQMERDCREYCALANLELADGWPACGVIHCTPDKRLDRKFVNFVKLAPRKKRHTL